MATFLNDIINLIDDKRRDTSTNSISDATKLRAIQSILRKMQQFHDWEFTIEKQAITFHKGITSYNLNSDFKTAQDLRRHKPTFTREFDMINASDFDNQTLTSYRFAIDTTGRTRTIRIQTDGDNTPINTATTITGEGTWAVSGHATTIAVDSFESFDLAASLNFDFAGTTGEITNTGMTAKVLNRFKDRSSVYYNVYLPVITNFRSIQMKVGSSASAYFTATATTDYLGNTPAIGWNIFKFDIWDTSVGSPDEGAIDYIQLVYAYNSSTTDTDFRFENIYVSTDVPLDLYYYSLDTTYDVGNAETTLWFGDISATTDYPLWTDKWDFVTDYFVDAVLAEIFWITGEETDRQIAEVRQREIFAELKRRLPSRRRQPEMAFTTGASQNSGTAQNNRRSFRLK